MMRRFILLALLSLSACEKSAKSPAVGDFPDNPLLAYVPADTPYVFATFKPIPADYVHKMADMVGPIWRRAFDTYMAKGSGDDQAKTKAVFDEIGSLDAKRLEELGIAPTARFVVYGMPGGFPVIRVELASGDRLLAFVQRVAGRVGEQVPPPTPRGAWKLWQTGKPDEWTVALAVAPTELVIAAAPTSALAPNLPGILGETKPVARVTTAQMHEVATRDGFTGQGLGYLDIGKLATLATASRSPQCQSAVRALAQTVPRIAVGYRDLSTRETSAGLVVELAPDALAKVRAVSGTLAGLDRMIASNPAIAMAVAGDLEHLRALLPAIGDTLGDLGQRCEALDLSSGADKLRELAGRPTPSFLTGLHGGMFAFDNLVMAGGVPKQLDGYLVIRSDHAAEVVKQLVGEMPGLDVPLDGKAHPLPASAMPFPGHVAATQDAIAGAVGVHSETKVVELLGGKPAPAPLFMVMFDYQRLGDLIPADPSDPSSADMKAFIRTLGVARINLTADQRGLVAWMTFGMK